MKNYIIITPAKDEELYIKAFIDSIISQSIKPKIFVIVNDGSHDKTELILNEYENKYDWIKSIHLDNSGGREEGSKIINAFYKGFDFVEAMGIKYEMISKIDADLILPSNYFERVLKEFSTNGKLGITGGVCTITKNNEVVVENTASYHIRGALKSVRKECFDDIGGFKRVLGWDGLDEMTSLYKGWEVKQISDLLVHQQRITFSLYEPLKLAKKFGAINYKNGGNVFLLVVRSIIRIKEKPYFIYSLVFFFSYIYAAMRREKKNIDKDLSRFINKFHTNRIFNP